MAPKNRRDFLKWCVASVPAVALANGIGFGEIRNTPAVGSGYRTPGSIDPYSDPLSIPRRMSPIATRDGKAEYRARMVECTRQMHSQLPPTKLWGFEGQSPGPTIEAHRGSPISVHWENRLPQQHIFPIDPHILGAAPPIPAVRTVTHLHGSRTPSASDGGPMRWFPCGSSSVYHYPNDQQAATLWYHDHAMGITRLNVYAGLAGFYLLRDDRELSMNLPSGEYEIPLMLQDRTLDEHAQLVYAPTRDDGQKLPPGVWGPGLFGELPVVNGGIYPYLDVEPCRYRLRILNACNSRYLHLFFNLAKLPTDIPSLVQFHQIGTDGGFISKPAPLDKVLLGPAERADLIVDFSGSEGKTVTLSNNAATPFPGWDVINPPNYAALNEWMQFRVNRRMSAKGKSFSMPPPLTLPRLAESKSVKTRDFVLSELEDGHGRSLGMRINGKTFNDPTTDFVKLNSIEKWRFINTTDDAHAMHLHLVQFQIVERQGYDPTAFFHGTLQLVGTPRPPAPNETGWKDTAVVKPRDVLTILIPFKGYTGRYGFHCHMLEHEDNGMMRPYEVVSDEPAGHPS